MSTWHAPARTAKRYTRAATQRGIRIALAILRSAGSPLDAAEAQALDEQRACARMARGQGELPLPMPGRQP